MKLKDKVVIITGGSQGLGKAFATRLHKEGAKIVIADITDPSYLINEFNKNGGNSSWVHTDVSDENSVLGMVKHTINKYDRIDILINNAGIFAKLAKKNFYEISSDEWDKILDVNLKGMFLCCKAVYPQMKKQRSGKIINISSGACFSGVPYFIHYVASKAGIVGFTRALANELGDDGINVNAVAPGLTLSDGVQRNPEVYPAEYLSRAAGLRCFKRDQTPDDLTGVVSFLACEDSNFITGQTIVVDGGSFFH